MSAAARDDAAFVRAAIAVAQRAREHGNHPFGAILVDAGGQMVLEAENTVITGRDCTGHAETNLMRLASARFNEADLAGFTVYTSTEPCVMCAGAMYWGGVGRVVYGLSSEALYRITGANPSLPLPCREVFARGARHVQVDGPFIEDEARIVHVGFWE
jgi:tRNA(Arg) A34 adenosine deaminase TadA